MDRRLREIAERRAELAIRSKKEREAIANNKLWSSGPVMIAGPLMGLGRAVISSSYKYYFGAALLRLWPLATLKWARRGLQAWMAYDRIKKTLLR